MTQIRSPGVVSNLGGLDIDQARRPMMMKLLCVINRHRPMRGEVHWEGTCYIASCKRCNEKIVRHKGSPWRKR